MVERHGVNIALFYKQRATKLRLYLRQTLTDFYAPQLYRQVLLRRVLAMRILSVCLSVTTRWYTKLR